MSNDQNLLFKEQLLSEIWDEIGSLEGRKLDEFLMEAAGFPSKRARFEEARRHVRSQMGRQSAKIVALDLPKKRQILAAIRERAVRTNEMTIAARNRKIDAEQDLDSFLEACVRLGVIDEDGNLKD
jgi:hypothetical protein